MTLIEVIICAGLMSMVFIGTYMIMDKGMQFYRLNSDANDAQRGILLFFSRLNTAMQNCDPNRVTVDPTLPAPVGAHPAPQQLSPSRGIAYASPFDSQHRVHLDPAHSNDIIWQNYGAFYLTPERDLKWVSVPIPGGPSATALRPGAVGITPTSTAVQSAPNSSLMVRNVTRLWFTLHAKHEYINPSNPADLRELDNLYYEVGIECGKKGDPLGYWVQVKSSFYPRN